MKINTYKILLVVVLLFTCGACGEDWLNVNDDPNNPKTATLKLLLPSVQVSTAFSMTRDINKNTMVFTRQVYDLTESQYLQDATIYSNDYDALFADALKDAQEVIDQGTEQEAWHYVAVGNIMKAYIYGVMVDMFGDLPFTEALKGDEFINPKFDEGAFIYDQLLTLLDEGIADLEKESSLALENDLIFNNSLSKWATAAKTIQLKLLLNLRLVNPDKATAGINALMTKNDLINTNEGDFQFQFGSSLSPRNQHPMYQIEYAGSGNKDNYMSNYFMYNLIKKNDPRLPYYIYRQGSDSDLNFETTPCNTRSDCVYGLLSGTDLGEAAEGYLGRDHGDPSGLPGDDVIRATYGVYPIGGSYDNNTRSERILGDGGQGAGIIPYVTNAMRAFMLAEAKLTMPGITGGEEAITYLEEGIRASMDKVESLGMSLDENAVAMPDSLVDDYVTQRIAEFNGGTSADQKLNVIMKEKYYAQFGNGMEVFTDYRRTGLPADLPASLAPLAPFPLRLPYSTTEIAGNPNAPNPLPSQDTPVFWDK